MSAVVQFGKPPVVETVISIQYPELVGFCSVHFGLYWDVIRERFRRFEDKPRLPEVGETFPRRLPLGEGVRISEVVGAQRVWYVAEDDTRVIQLQPNRFLFNWRGQRGQTYPSYDANSKAFLDEFAKFSSFCEKHELEPPAPRLCEVSYVNHIIPEAGESALELFGRMFCGLKWESADGWLPVPESVSFNRVYVIGEDRGRLYAEAAIGVKLPEKREFVQLNLTGRVNCVPEGMKGLTDALQLAHDWVVNGFANMTNPEIQIERWERKT